MGWGENTKICIAPLPDAFFCTTRCVIGWTMNSDRIAVKYTSASDTSFPEIV
jgi:hypothetical protein